MYDSLLMAEHFSLRAAIAISEFGMPQAADYFESFMKRRRDRRGEIQSGWTANSCLWLEQVARIWDATEGRPLAMLGPQESVVQDGCFTRAGDRALTASGTTISVWNCDDGTCMRKLVGKREDGFSLGTLEAVVLSPDESMVLALHDDHISYVWNLNTGERLATIDIGQGNLKVLHF